MATHSHRNRCLQHLRVLVLLGLCAVPFAAALRSRSSRPVRQSYDDSNSLVEYPEQRLLSSSQQQYNFANNNNGGDRNGTDNRKPAFRDCINYTPSVREEQPSGVFVIKVQAFDPDEHDRIEYSFVNAISERPKFRIDPRSGDIYTVYQFDRDEPAREKEVSVVPRLFVFSNFMSILSFDVSLPKHYPYTPMFNICAHSDQKISSIVYLVKYWM